MSELRPLTGTRVVDVTSSLAGPTATQLLAALGAEVVKVEPLGGDHARAWGPPFVEGEGAMFLASNAGKRSLAVELGDDRGRDQRDEPLEAALVVRPLADRGRRLGRIALSPVLAAERPAKRTSSASFSRGRLEARSATSG